MLPQRRWTETSSDKDGLVGPLQWTYQKQCCSYFFFFGFFFLTPPAAGPAGCGMNGEDERVWSASLVVSGVPRTCAIGVGRLFCIFCISDRFKASNRLRKIEE
jgi:hypothetical protein